MGKDWNAKASQVIIAGLVALVVLTCCLSGSLTQTFFGGGPWGLDHYDIFPNQSFTYHDDLIWETRLYVVVRAMCFGSPLLAATAGAVVFWALGRRKRS